MKIRATPKLDSARTMVRAVLERGAREGWSLHRLRAEMRAAFPFCMVSRTTWRTAVVLTTGHGLRGLADPRHETLARMRGGAS